jgi:hypothetical protein
MIKNGGSFQCPKCRTLYRTQEEAERCGARKDAAPAHKVGDTVRYTFFSMTSVGRDQSEDYNRWKVLDPAIRTVPDHDDGHECLVQVEQVRLKRRSTERDIRVFPASELI